MHVLAKPTVFMKYHPPMQRRTPVSIMHTVIERGHVRRVLALANLRVGKRVSHLWARIAISQPTKKHSESIAPPCMHACIPNEGNRPWSHHNMPNTWIRGRSPSGHFPIRPCEMRTRGIVLGPIQTYIRHTLKSRRPLTWPPMP